MKGEKISCHNYSSNPANIWEIQNGILARTEHDWANTYKKELHYTHLGIQSVGEPPSQQNRKLVPSTNRHLREEKLFPGLW